MATFKGDNGIIKIGSVTVGEIMGWTVEQQTDMIEDTVVGDAAKTFIAGQTSWSGTCEAILSSSDTGQVKFDNGSLQTALDFYFDATTSAYKGNALVTGISSTSTIGEMTKVSISFQGTGALTSDPWS